jgi:uncharacterized protein (DUF1330 family)
MPAYLIVHRREIVDPERLKEYSNGINATIAKFGGKVVVRADRFEVLEGDWHPGRKGDDSHPERITVIAFPDMDSLKAWYGSPEYAPLKAIRQASAICDVAATSGDTA